MRILQLCKKFPYPLKDGESIAITYLAKALQEAGHELHLLAMNTTKHYFDVSDLPEDMKHYSLLKTVDVDNRVKPVEAFINLFTDESYHISRFIQPAFAQQLNQLLTEYHYDVVLLETVYLAPYVNVIRKMSDAKVVMRAHNVEHEIWERLTENANPLKRIYLNHITPRLRSFEIQSLNQYDLLAGITQRDVDKFRSLGMTIPSMALPVGLDTRNYMANQLSFKDPLSLGFIGSLDWMPNIEGLKWFLEDVWTPYLVPKFPELTLHIAGRNTPDWLKRMESSRIRVHGEVPDATTFMLQHTLMIVPLLSGGGMRVKILESMALGRVNITTRVGMEGIEAEHGQHLLVADTPTDFVSAIEFCYAQPCELQNIGLRAQVLCAAKYDNYKLAQQLLTYLGDLQKSKSSVPQVV